MSSHPAAESPIIHNERTAAMTFHSLPESMPKQMQTFPAHDAKTLTDGGNQAQIILDDQTYTLRITRAGKLILTK